MEFDESGLYNIKAALDGERYSLYDLATWKNGLAFKKSDFSEKGRPIIKIAELNNGISANTSYTQKDFGEEVFCCWDDLLFSWSGNPQTSIDVFRYRLPDGWLNQHIFKITANESIVTKEYIYYVLKFLKPRFTQIATNKQTTGLGHVTIADLKRLSLIIPPKSAQIRIVSILKSIDDIIELNNRINENLAQQAQAIFVNMFVENETTIPATVADVSLNVTDGVHNTVHDDPEGDFLLLSCKNIKGGSLSIGSSERRISFDTFVKLRRRTKLSKGDVLISSVGTVGELLLLNVEPSNYEFQRSVAMVKPNTNIVSPAYLYEALVFRRAELINAAHGAVQQCLFISDIAGFPIGIPQPDDLRDFDTTVVPMFNIISVNEAENHRLAEMRDALLPKLMSGELDVSNINL